MESMGIHLTIALTTNKAGSSRKIKATTGPEALMINLPETEKHPTRSATGAKNTITPRKIAGASSSVSASSIGKRSTGTQLSMKKIMLRRWMKITNQTMKVLLRLVL